MTAFINRNFYRRHPKRKKDSRSAKEKSENQKKCHSEVYDTTEWKKLRILKLQNDPLCERCWDKYKKVTPALDVHHKVPILDDPDKKFDYDNLMSLCRKCHIEVHRELREQKKTEEIEDIQHIKVEDIL